MEESRGKKIRKDGGVRVACEMGREEKLLNDETICSVKLLAHTSTNSKTSSMATSSVTKRETAISRNTPIFFLSLSLSWSRLLSAFTSMLDLPAWEHDKTNWTHHTQLYIKCTDNTHATHSATHATYIDSMELTLIRTRSRVVACTKRALPFLMPLLAWRRLYFWPLRWKAAVFLLILGEERRTARLGHVIHIMLMHLWLFWGCCQVLRVWRSLVNLLQLRWDAVGWPNMIQTLLAMEMCQAPNVGCTEAKFTIQLSVK